MKRNSPHRTGLAFSPFGGSFRRSFGRFFGGAQTFLRLGTRLVLLGLRMDFRRRTDADFRQQTLHTVGGQRARADPMFDALFLQDQAFLEQTRVRIATARMALCSCLDRLGITYLPSQTNFVTVHLPGSASEVTRRLLADQVHVRDATDMGMPGWIRISVGTPSDVLSLVGRLEAVLAPHR